MLTLAGLLAVAAVADWEGAGRLRLMLAVLYAGLGTVALTRLRHLPDSTGVSGQAHRPGTTLVKWMAFAGIVVRILGGIALVVVGLTPRDPIAARVVELVAGIGFFVWGLYRLRWWRGVDWQAGTQ